MRQQRGMGAEKYRAGFQVRIHPDTLNTPYTWRKTKIVFVNSMSDLFHDDVPLDFIKAVFAVMNDSPQHIYQVLTKRSQRLFKLSSELNWTENIWMGVSVETEKYTYRISDLSLTPAKTKFISIEPLIGPVRTLNLGKIDWVIVGGESGHKARPVKKEWIDFIKSRCLEENVPFFFKQWGKPKFNSNQFDPTIDKDHPNHAKGGCELDGEIYRGMPTTNLQSVD